MVWNFVGRRLQFHGILIENLHSPQGRGGNKGVSSVIGSLGNGFTQIRVGVGRPKEKTDNIVTHVLSRFPSPLTHEIRNWTRTWGWLPFSCLSRACLAPFLACFVLWFSCLVLCSSFLVLSCLRLSFDFHEVVLSFLCKCLMSFLSCDSLFVFAFFAFAFRRLLSSCLILPVCSCCLCIRAFSCPVLSGLYCRACSASFVLCCAFLDGRQASIGSRNLIELKNTRLVTGVLRCEIGDICRRRARAREIATKR